MLLELIERLFSRSQPSSRQQVKNRLKLVLAHDRTDLSAEMLNAMRKEILGVVSRYVELDMDGMEFSLESSEGATALIANLPIRRVHAAMPAVIPVEPAVESPVPVMNLDLSLESLALAEPTPSNATDPSPAPDADAQTPPTAPTV